MSKRLAGLMAVLLCFAVVVPVFATGGPESGAANKNLEIAIFEGGMGKVYWQAVSTQFEKDNPGVKVTMTASPKIEDMMKPRFAAGNPPDFLMHNPQPGIYAKYASDGLVRDLTDVFTSQALDQKKPLKDIIIPGFLDFGKVLDDGKVYFAPLDIQAMGIVYNKKLLASKGWSVPKTWDEFFQLGDKAKAAGIALFTYQGIYPSYNEMILLAAICNAAGPKALEKIQNYEEGAWRDPIVRKALDLFARIANGGYLLPGTTALNHTQSQTEFLNGKALFIPCGNWLEQEMKDVLPKTGWEYGFIPSLQFKSGDKLFVESGLETMYIPAKAKNPELAKAFLKYQYIWSSVKLLAQTAGGVTAILGGTNLVKDYVSASVVETLKVFDDPSITPLFSKFKPAPTTTVSIFNEIYNPINDIMNKTMTVDQWIDRLETANATIRKDIASAR